MAGVAGADVAGASLCGWWAGAAVWLVVACGWCGWWGVAGVFCDVLRQGSVRSVR